MPTLTFPQVDVKDTMSAGKAIGNNCVGFPCCKASMYACFRYRVMQIALQ